MRQISLNKKFNTPFRNNTLPVLLYLGEVSGIPTWSHPMHKHDDFIELIFVIEGSGSFIINNMNYTVEPGDILIYERGVLHHECSDPENPIKTCILAVDDVYLFGVDDKCILSRNVSPVIKSGPYYDTMIKYLELLNEECEKKEFDYESIAQNILAAIITLILRIITVSHNFIETTPETLGFKIKEFIDENYNKDIKLNDIAEKFYLSPYYLSHIFKKEIEFSPIDYLINRRIGEAQKLLLTTAMPICDISKQVGYDNVNYFNLAFKKIAGISPNKFREMYNNEKSDR